METFNIAERMKMYESHETSRKFIPLLPVMARMDGRSFHNFCKRMQKPYDMNFMKAMQNTTKQLVKETNAVIGYTQSDEITLIFNSDDIKSEIFFAGKIHKMNSQLASLTTVNFIMNSIHYKLIEHQLPTFDCRVWQVPNKMEAVNCLIWRQQDCMRNSINLLAQHHFSHKQLHKKSVKEVLLMLEEIGVYWDQEDHHFKNGFFYKDNSEMLYPKLSSIANSPDVIFYDADIILKDIEEN